MNVLTRARGWVLAVALLCGLVIVAVSAGSSAHAATTRAAGTGPALPSADPFYAYSGSLADVAPGTVLRTRSVSFDVSGLDVPVQTEQLLYRTVNGVGQPSVAVTTVIRPLAAVSTHIVSWQEAYDGLAGNCDPSYAIQGGSPTEETNPLEQTLMVPVLASGDTLVVPDYEGEGNDFVGGREEGEDTLDSIRAAENYLKVPQSSTPVALQGYSGGAIASGWASVLAPTYAPDLDIVGTAFGGIVVDLVHNLNYINGSTDWAGAIPAALVGIARSLQINLTPYLSAYGESVVKSVSGACLQSAVADYPGLTYQKMFKPQYQDLTQIPVFVKAFNELNMAHGGVPRDPLYMGVGDSDGTGDGVMVTADDEALAHTFCQEGLPVQFSIYQGQNHGGAALNYLPGAIAFVEGRLNGVAASNGCSSIGAGNSLALLPTPAAAAAPQHAERIQARLSRVTDRLVRLRLRSIGYTHAPVLTARLLNARGRTLASTHVRATARVRTVTLRLRHRLTPGRYRVRLLSGRHTVSQMSFTVRRPRRA